MKYEVSYYFKDGKHTLLIQKKYKSDLIAYKEELEHILNHNNNKKNRKIISFTLYRYVPQHLDFKTIIKQNIE